jgi:hypothetical protein
LWPALHLALLQRLQALGELAWSRAVVDFIHEGAEKGDYDACFVDDLPHRGGGRLYAYDKQFAVHAPVAPTRILPRQTQHQDADGPQRARTARPLGAGDDRVSTGEQLPMPAQDRVRPHEQLHPAQSLQRQPVQQRRQQRSVSGLQSHLLIAELALQHGDLMA